MKLSSHEFLFDRIINKKATFPYIIHHNEKKSNKIVLMCSNRLLSFTKYGQENSTKYKLKREKKSSTDVTNLPTVYWLCLYYLNAM